MESLIRPLHVLITLIASILTLTAVLLRFRNNVLDELRVTRISIKELLADLADRNPEAMGRIISAMNDQNVTDFVRQYDQDQNKDKP